MYMYGYSVFIQVTVRPLNCILWSDVALRSLWSRFPHELSGLCKQALLGCNKELHEPVFLKRFDALSLRLS